MDLAEEDWEGHEEGANEDISWKNLVLCGPSSAARKNNFLRQLTEQAKKECAARSNAGRPTDGVSLLLVRG